MESKYIDLVINRLTQAQYDELKKNNQINEEELYDIIDHDDLFYYKTELYTKDEIENKLSGVLSTLRGEIASEKAELSSSIKDNTDEINTIKKDLIPGVQSDLVSTNNDLSTFKTTVSNTYATKQELSEYSPVEANPTLAGNETVLDSINIDGTNYQVYPNGEVEFDTVKSEDASALTLGSIRVGNDIWNLPTELDTSAFYDKEEIDLKFSENTTSIRSNYYNKAEVDKKITDAATSGQIDLSNYYNKQEVDAAIDAIDVSDQLTEYALKTELPTKTSQLTNDSGFLTEHQSLEGYAKETYVDQKVYSLIGSTPETLDTLHELATALGNDPNFATTITTQLGKKANITDVYTKSEVDTAIENVVASDELENYYTKTEVDDALSNIELDNYYTKEEIDNKDFTNVSANPEVTGEEIPLTTVSIKGVNYIVSSGDEDNSLILSDTPVEGASNLASVTINGDSWNIVGSGGGGSLNPEDLADYYTKSEVNTQINKEVQKLLNAAPEAYDTFKEISDYIESDLTNTSAMLADIAKKANSADVYTKSEANAKYALKSEIPAPTDLSNYYTKNETLEVIDKINGLDNYYDKTEVDVKVENINSSIATKQNTLVSGENIKTINGVSIVGAGNILINEGNSGGTPVEANPALDGTEPELTSVAINNVNYAIPSGEMLFSERVVLGQKALKTVTIDGDVWSIEKGSTLIANVPLTGDEDALDSVQIDDTVYTLKGEEMLFYEQELPDSVPLKTIVINDDKWYVGGLSEEKVDAKIDTRINALVNTAPDTLDTLGELATALQENAGVVEALNSAISNKADKNEIVKSYNQLTDKPTIPKIVFSETEPTNPQEGLIWLRPI